MNPSPAIYRGEISFDKITNGLLKEKDDFEQYVKDLIKEDYSCVEVDEGIASFESNKNEDLKFVLYQTKDNDDVQKNEIIHLWNLMNELK